MQQLDLMPATKQRRMRETKKLYAAVVFLRKQGHRVYRAGRDILWQGRYARPSDVIHYARRLSRDFSTIK